MPTPVSVPSPNAADGRPVAVGILPLYSSAQDTDANVSAAFGATFGAGIVNSLVVNLVNNVVYCGNFSLTNTAFPNLATYTLPNLIQTGNLGSPATTFTVTAMSNLTTLSAPAYTQHLGTGAFTIQTSPLLKSVFLPLYQGNFGSATAAISFLTNIGLVTLSLPSLARLAPGGLVVSGNTALTTFSAPLNAVVFQTPTATPFDFSGNALTQAVVDDILVRLAANTPFAGASCSVNLTGGTNSTPSATGLAAKATLVARSVVVTNN